MARWIRFVGIAAGGSYFSGAGGFLAVVLCVLAVVTVAAGLCGLHFRREEKTLACDSVGLQEHRVSPRPHGKALTKLFVAKKWARSQEEEAQEFLWQRHILMGERCQPPDFSGLIIYDENGNRLPQFPERPPRFSPVPPSYEADVTVQR